MYEPEYEPKFYCLGCRQLLTTERAERLFKTGYYRWEFRLGICADCSGLNFVKNAGLTTLDWYNRSDNP